MRLTARRALGIVATTLVVPAVACVLADPPASVPATPVVAPEIDHELVVPPVTSILTAWPAEGEFDVPILVLDPSVTVEWEAFVDYDPLSGGQPYVAPGEVGPGQDVDDAGERLLVARIPPPADLTSCHTLEILVALGFAENHTPNSVGGDSVTWFYSPTGSLDGCPIFEAGVPDAGEDASAPVDASADDGGAG
jgi:hypothetical protein